MLHLFYLGFGVVPIAAVLAHHHRAARLSSTWLAHRAKRLSDAANILDFEMVSPADLQRGDHVLCVRDDIVPADGVVVEGAAQVDAGAVVGGSTWTVRAGADGRTAVTGGTRVRSGYLVVRIGTPLGAVAIERILGATGGAAP